MSLGLDLEIRDRERRAPLRLNVAAFFALSLIIFIWVEPTPIWLPAVSWVAGLLESALLPLCAIFLALSGFLMFGLALAVIGLFLTGTITRSE
jgi:hypothetical protein